MPIFQRLFLLLKLKPAEQRGAEIAAATGIDQARAVKMARKRREHLPTGVSSGKIYVKVFKRIPQVDLEMLFPNTRIAFRPVRQAEALRHRGRRHGGGRGGDRDQAARGDQSLHARDRARRAVGGDLPPGDGLLQHAQPLHDGAGAEPLFLQPRQQSRRAHPDRRQRRGGGREGGHAALRLPRARALPSRRAARGQGRHRPLPQGTLRRRASATTPRTPCAACTRTGWSAPIPTGP